RCRSSSAGQSNAFVMRRPWVRIPPPASQSPREKPCVPEHDGCAGSERYPHAPTLRGSLQDDGETDQRTTEQDRGDAISNRHELVFLEELCADSLNPARNRKQQQDRSCNG